MEHREGEYLVIALMGTALAAVICSIGARLIGLSYLWGALAGWLGLPLAIVLFVGPRLLCRRFSRRSASAAWILALLAAPLLSSCSTTGGVTPVINVTPATVASIAYDAGYLTYAFGPPNVQSVVKGVCLLDTTQDPAQLAAEFQQILSQAWSGIDKLNSGESTAIMLLLNNLVTQLGLQDTVTSLNISPELISAIQGFCQGVEACQAGILNKALLRAAQSGVIRADQIPPITIGAPPELVAPAMPINQQGSSAWNQVLKALEFWKR